MSQSVQASHHRLEVGALDRIELTAFGFVDQVEQARERIAEIEAAAAAVTDIEDPAEFLVELLFVEKVGLAPFDQVTRRRLKAAFAWCCTCGLAHDPGPFLQGTAGGWRTHLSR